jgi:Fe-S cluster assembly iron-binding protein IscA
MLTVTEAACTRLADKLAKKSADDDVALRFVRNKEKQGWALQLDKACPSDVSFSHEGRIVLVLDQRSSQLLRNRLLEVRETDEGPKLRLRARCGD